MIVVETLHYWYLFLPLSHIHSHVIIVECSFPFCCVCVFSVLLLLFLMWLYVLQKSANIVFLFGFETTYIDVFSMCICSFIMFCCNISICHVLLLLIFQNIYCWFFMYFSVPLCIVSMVTFIILIVKKKKKTANIA